MIQAGVINYVIYIYSSLKKEFLTNVIMQLFLKKIRFVH